MKVRDASNVLRTVSRLSVRDGSNNLRVVSTMKLRDGSNNLRVVTSIGGMIVTASPSDAFGYGNSHAPIVISTTGCTVSIDGGTAPYTVLWSADLGQMEAISPSSYTTSFRSIGGVGPGDSTNDTFTCTVTDAHGNIAVSNAVSATASNFGT